MAVFSNGQTVFSEPSALKWLCPALAGMLRNLLRLLMPWLGSSGGQMVCVGGSRNGGEGLEFLVS